MNPPNSPTYSLILQQAMDVVERILILLITVVSVIRVFGTDSRVI